MSSFIPTRSIDSLLNNVHDVTVFTRRDPRYPHPIGCGTGGDVVRAVYDWADTRTGQRCSLKVAVKLFRSNNNNYQSSSIEQRVRREVAAWRYLDHPNVAKFLGIAYIEPGRPPGVVSLFMQRNDILEYLDRHPEMKHQKVLEITAGLQYLHANGVIHGDLKAANIMISDYGVAIINDFGISRIIDTKGFSTKLLLNVRHNAPELMPVQEVPDQAIAPTTQSDIFSFGILLLQLSHGFDQDTQRGLPYNHVRFQTGIGRELRLLRLIHAGERPIRERYRRMSDDYWRMIRWCWDGNAALRPTIGQVMSSLQGFF